MKAETVFEVYKALEHSEQDRLYDMVKAHFNSKYDFKRSKKGKKLDFTKADAMRYLIEKVVVKKIKKS